ncbi:MAG: hypothetical protein ABEH43_03485, partial [Flavobacteriales bacterium]
INSSSGEFINPADYDSNQDILYAEWSASKILRISDITGTFTVDSPATSFNAEVSHFRVSPYTTSSSTLFIGTEDSRVFKVTNAESSF